MMQRIAIVFVDDTDFCVSGEEYEENMQKIMDQCTKLYEVTGGEIKQGKTMFCCWTWRCCNEEKIIKQVEAELMVHGEKN